MELKLNNLLNSNPWLIGNFMHTIKNITTTLQIAREMVNENTIIHLMLNALLISLESFVQIIIE